MKHITLFLQIFTVALSILCIFGGKAFCQESIGRFAGKKVLYVNSYSKGYPWGDGIEQSIRAVLEPTGIVLQVFHMGTKLNPTPEFMTATGRKAKEAMDNFMPDAVIASDDNAQKYFVVPYLLNTDMPVVFCGVNWDASEYGYPAKNVTGMVELDGIEEILPLLKRDAKGSAIGFISGDSFTQRKIAHELNSRFFSGKMKVCFVTTFDAFKRNFLQLQNEVDILFIRNYASIQGWENDKAVDFLAQNTRVPTGSNLEFMADYVIYTIGKLPEEQGEYAAQTVLRILGGTPPADIPIVQNEHVHLIVNLKMADALGIVVPFNVLKTARIIGP